MTNSKSKKTILFTPMLSGLAHVVRCMAIAENLPEFRCVLVVEPRRFTFITQNFRLHKLPSNMELVTHNADFYDTPEFQNAVAKSGFPRKEFLAEHKTYMKFIENLKPDLVVSDNNLFGLMAAQINGIPNTYLTTMILLPYHSRYIKSTNSKPVQRLLDTVGLKVANKLVRKFSCDILKMFEDESLYNFKHGVDKFYDSLDKVLFENKAKVAMRADAPNVSYFPLPISRFELGTKEDFESIKKQAGDKRAVYVTMGGTGFNPKLSQSLVKAFLKAGYFVMCSTAQIYDPKALPKTDSLYARNFIPGQLASALADVVVSHGSQGTVAEAVATKTPLIGIPFNFDQYLTLDIEASDTVINALSLTLYKMSRTVINPTYSISLPNKVDPQRIVELANSLPVKNTDQKRFNGDQNNKLIVDYIKSKLEQA